MSIPKPKYCGQEWLEMKPTESGRLCGDCRKNIVDFTKKTWSEIEEIQRVNNNTVCGMYTNKQLKYWGQEAPIFNPNKKIISTALIVGLSTVNLSAQTNSNIDTPRQKIIITGTILGKTNSTEKSPVPFAAIRLKNTQCVNRTNFNGQFELDITNYIDSVIEPVIIVSSVGYDKLEYKIIEPVYNKANYEIQLVKKEYNVTHFYIGRPTRWQRFKRKVKRIFQ